MQMILVHHLLFYNKIGENVIHRINYISHVTRRTERADPNPATPGLLVQSMVLLPTVKSLPDPHP